MKKPEWRYRCPVNLCTWDDSVRYPDGDTVRCPRCGESSPVADLRDGPRRRPAGGAHRVLG